MNGAVVARRFPGPICRSFNEAEPSDPDASYRPVACASALYFLQRGRTVESGCIIIDTTGTILDKLLQRSRTIGSGCIGETQCIRRFSGGCFNEAGPCDPDASGIGRVPLQAVVASTKPDRVIRMHHRVDHDRGHADRASTRPDRVIRMHSRCPRRVRCSTMCFNEAGPCDPDASPTHHVDVLVPTASTRPDRVIRMRPAALGLVPITVRLQRGRTV